MLRTVQSLPQKGFRHWASTRTVSNPSRQSATGPADSYPDRTHTGKRRRARTADHPFTRPPPIPLGAQTKPHSPVVGAAANRPIGNRSPASSSTPDTGDGLKLWALFERPDSPVPRTGDVSGRHGRHTQFHPP